eukprot:CAMPEP_0184312636 /NCGR_PEP_ID=MMETSP1049-20130417/50954_1 /TAXON_ID=77928 /ORGANISM="Proteomonas sulcata, Strain CCMP704" /LENGTH=54 /DNA_ID=CAMNT_0026628917 /DNA_START=45 /DNA_END=209 /DNA_ORIENTATION=-
MGKAISSMPMGTSIWANTGGANSRDGENLFGEMVIPTLENGRRGKDMAKESLRR